MRVRDYLRGYSLQMQSRLRREEIERRINATTLSGWQMFKEGVSGWARFGVIRLRYRTRFVHYTGAPILAGRIDDEFGMSRLRLRYRAPLPTYLFFSAWYAFFAFIAFNVVLAIDSAPGAESAMFIGLMLLFLLAPIAMHYAYTRRADAQFETIVRFLEDTAEAKVVGGRRRP